MAVIVEANICKERASNKILFSRMFVNLSKLLIFVD